MEQKKSKSLYQKAINFIPGGVNSPVRAFKSVGGTPLFIQKAAGAYLHDVDGNAYIDLINSWGPMILGHGHPEVAAAIQKATSASFSYGAPTEQEVKMAELVISLVPSIEKVRMVNSGTEATMSAIRLARGYTGKDKIIKFAGCYHGHGDSFLIAAGSGAATFGVPNSPGVTKGTASDTLIAQYNDLASVEALINANQGEIAAIILEPVAGNMGTIVPSHNFLSGLRRLCDQYRILLIFDEVMTGFRLALGGAQEKLGVIPDITTLGKIIGGGLPVGAFGARAEIMDYISPVGPVYQAGTLSGNPLAMQAGYTMLSLLKAHPEYYTSLEETGKILASELKQLLQVKNIPFQLNQIGSMLTLFFTETPVIDFDSAKTCDTKRFGHFFHAMLNRGVYLPPSQFEAMFLSTAIREKEIEHILTAAKASIEEILSQKAI